MARAKPVDDKDKYTNIDEHNRSKLREVQSKIARVRKAQLLERAVKAKAGSSTLSRGEISVTYLARAVSPASSLAGTTAGIIVMDEGSDNDLIIMADLDDTTDGMTYGDKDVLDGVSQVDKDGRDWPF